MDISYRLTPPLRSAGMVSVHVNTRLPAYSRTFQDGGCTIAEDKVITPLLFVVHTHRLGEVVSLWRVRRDKYARGADQWTLIGKKSPQAPQSFYPVEDPEMTLRYGDR